MRRAEDTGGGQGEQGGLQGLEAHRWLSILVKMKSV
jgi:hypothetical protein